MSDQTLWRPPKPEQANPLSLFFVASHPHPRHPWYAELNLCSKISKTEANSSGSSQISFVIRYVVHIFALTLEKL